MTNAHLCGPLVSNCPAKSQKALFEVPITDFKSYYLVDNSVGIVVERGDRIPKCSESGEFLCCLVAMLSPTVSDNDIFSPCLMW